MRVAVCGCRNANRPDTVWAWLDAWLNRLNCDASSLYILLEDVKGINAFVYDWASARGCEIEVGQFNWEAIDTLVAFPGASSTLILEAKDRRIPWRWARTMIYKETKGRL